MQCAWAIAHDACRMDCPDCNDYRMRPEEPWLSPSSPAPRADDERRMNRANRIRRVQRVRDGVRARSHQQTNPIGERLLFGLTGG